MEKLPTMANSSHRYDGTECSVEKRWTVATSIQDLYHTDTVDTYNLLKIKDNMKMQKNNLEVMSFECLLSLCLLSYLGAGLYVYNLILLMDVFNNWLENS